MAQGTTINSAGTTLSGGDGGGTQSGLMNVLHTIKYLKLIRAIKKNQKPQKADDDKQEQKPEDSSTSDSIPVEVVFEDDPQSILPGGRNTKQLTQAKAGTKSLPSSQQQLLPSAEDEEDMRLFELKIGDFYLRERYANFRKHFQNLDLEQQAALTVAAAGGQPNREVSITTWNAANETIQLTANSETNSGWSIITENETIKPAVERLNEQIQRQESPAMEGIRGVMHEIFEGEGPHTISGPRFTISMDDNTVFVVENDSGRILDAVELDNLSGEVVKASQAVNGETRNEQVREAIADFQGIGGAAIASTPQPNKQRELSL